MLWAVCPHRQVLEIVPVSLLQVTCQFELTSYFSFLFERVTVASSVICFEVVRSLNPRFRRHALDVQAEGECLGLGSNATKDDLTRHGHVGASSTSAHAAVLF